MIIRPTQSRAPVGSQSQQALIIRWDQGSEIDKQCAQVDESIAASDPRSFSHFVITDQDQELDNINILYTDLNIILY